MTFGLVQIQNLVNWFDLWVGLKSHLWTGLLSNIPPDDIIANWEIIQEEATVLEEDNGDNHGKGEMISPQIWPFVKKATSIPNHVTLAIPLYAMIGL